MATQENIQKRYKRIHEVFLRHRGVKSLGVKLEDLAGQLGITTKQLGKDMDYLRTQGAPFEYIPSLRSWKYKEGHNFLYFEGQFINEEDIINLRVAIETLNLINNPQGKLGQIPAVFNKIYRAARQWWKPESLEKYIYFDPLPNYEGTKYLPFFLKAIEGCRRVVFFYLAFHTNIPKSVLFDPYFLRYYDRRWYVGGFSHDPSEGFVRVFPLERIQGDPVLEGFFHDKPQDYNAATYWKDIYGITVPPNRQVEDVVLEFNAIQGRYFLTTPFYEPFEIVEQSPEKLVVRMRLVPNIDLTNKLASFGARVKVLAPARLAQEMAGIHRAAAGLYD